MSDEQLGPETAAPPSGVGAQLRAAREARGLSLADVAARTRIVQRFVGAIERGAYGDLPSPTYAVGFAKAMARVLDLDEVAIGRDTRAEVAATVAPRTQYQIEEIADPARAPSRGLVVVVAGLLLAALVLGGLWFATDGFRGATTAGSGTPVAAELPAQESRPAAAPSTAPANGPVVLAATDEVWLRVYDAAGQRLYEGTMKAGDRFEVPATANGPLLNIGRPDKLQITVGGRAIPPLGDGSRPLKDVAVSAAALGARAGGPAPSPSATPLVPLVAPGAATTPAN